MKTRKDENLASLLADAKTGTPEFSRHAVQAALLCKADLVSAMVREFPELQGTMGGYYARLAGLPEEVATAIAEHYLPRGANDDLPGSRNGMLLSVADRLDLIASALGMNLRPTSHSDPYAVRRAMLGIVRIVTSPGWADHFATFDFTHGMRVAVDTLPLHILNPDTYTEAVDFGRSRIESWIQSQGIAPGVVASVLEVSLKDLSTCLLRATALQESQADPGFKGIVTAVKRVSKFTGNNANAEVDPALLVEPAEIALWEALGNATPLVRDAVARRKFVEVIRALTGLVPHVDTFFEKVMVNVSDVATRDNRIALVWAFQELSNEIADFTKL